jgi:hypothetical protein
MRKSVFTVWGVALGLMAGLSLSGCGKDDTPAPAWGPTTRPSRATTRPSTDLTVDSATARLVGTWEAIPIFDEDAVRQTLEKAGTPADKIAEKIADRAAVLKNLHLKWTVGRDGTINVTTTDGAAEAQVTKGDWKIDSVTGNVARLSVTPADQTVQQYDVAFEGKDRFNAAGTELKGGLWKLPIVFNRVK